MINSGDDIIRHGNGIGECVLRTPMAGIELDRICLTDKSLFSNRSQELIMRNEF